MPAVFAEYSTACDVAGSGGCEAAAGRALRLPRVSTNPHARDCRERGSGARVAAPVVSAHQHACSADSAPARLAHGLLHGGARALDDIFPRAARERARLQRPVAQSMRWVACAHSSAHSRRREKANPSKGGDAKPPVVRARTDDSGVATVDLRSETAALARCRGRGCGQPQGRAPRCPAIPRRSVHGSDHESWGACT